MSQGKPLLEPEEVASVLAPDGESAKAERRSDEPLAYSLREPRTIPPEGEARARERAEALVQAFADVLRRELESEPEFTLEGFRQQRARSAVEAVEQPTWVWSFLHAAGGGLVFLLHPSTALALVEVALGGFGNAPENGRGPTPLERRVMTKLAAALAPPLGRAAGVQLQPATLEVDELPPGFAAPGEMVGAALVQARIAEGRQTCMLLVSTGLLDPDERRKDEHTIPFGPLSRTLGKARVEARPVLRAGSVSLEDLMALEPGAVLRLDAPESTPLDLRVGGVSVFSGHIERREEGPVFLIGARRGSRRRRAHKEER